MFTLFPGIDAPACIDWPTPVGDYRSQRYPMRNWQAGRCAFCGDVYSRLVRDHDHDTGIIRGLLCDRCNTNEPFEWANPAWDLYRDQCNPSEILGIREEYNPVHFVHFDYELGVNVPDYPEYERRLAWAML